MKKGKGRNSVVPTPARPKKHTLHFLLHGDGNETVKGTLVLDNFPVDGNLGVGGLSAPVESGEQEYDQAGASVYAIVVIAVYGFSIVMLIASHIFLKKKADKRDGGDEKQIDKYLAQVPSLKEKSKRDSFRRLKKSIIPLLSVGMANDITAIAAGPLGHSAFQKHMGRSPSRTPSACHSPSAVESPPGGQSPRTLSPSLDESSGDDYDDSIKLEMPLEKDRSFDKVSQSRMPIIVEIDEATDSPTAAGRPLPPGSSAEHDKGPSESGVTADCSLSIESLPEARLTVSPWEKEELQGTSAAVQPPGGNTKNDTQTVLQHGQPCTASGQRVRSPRRCHPSELEFDLPDRLSRHGGEGELPVARSSSSSDEECRDALSDHSKKPGPGKRTSLTKWTPVGYFQGSMAGVPRYYDEDDDDHGKGLKITFV